MASTRRRFSPEFKEAAVREIIEKSRPIADVARENGLVPQSLGNWVNAPSAEAQHRLDTAGAQLANTAQRAHHALLAAAPPQPHSPIV